MIIIKSAQEIDLMRESGKVTGYILKELENIVKPGISTADIDAFVEKTIRKAGMVPTFLGYGGFPASACVSVNEEVVHGIPDKNGSSTKATSSAWMWVRPTRDTSAMRPGPIRSDR